MDSNFVRYGFIIYYFCCVFEFEFFGFFVAGEFVVIVVYILGVVKGERSFSSY